MHVVYAECMNALYDTHVAHQEESGCVSSTSKGVTLVYLNTVIRWTRFKAAKPLSYK